MILATHMPLFRNLPIMPKEVRASRSGQAEMSAPYPSISVQGQRHAAIWSSADDEILLQARASGLNWQPIASTHFPNKTANACRKRHERLVERRHGEDWDSRKLEMLAEEYLACRKEMWEMLAVRLGERWTLVEAKCMEKGLKNLQAIARTAQRKASAASYHHLGHDGRGISDHNSDSGIGLGSEAEMEIGEDGDDEGDEGEEDDHRHHQQYRQQLQQQQHVSHSKSSSWHVQAAQHGQHPPSQPKTLPRDHTRSRSVPQPLPLYQPPPPIARVVKPTHEMMMTRIPEDVRYVRRPSNEASSYYSRYTDEPPHHQRPQQQRYSPDSNGRGGISIQSVLSD